MPWSSKPVDTTVDFPTSNLAGKIAIVTGGANGIGKAYVRALHSADATVVVGDMNADDGQRLALELPGIKFVQCDVTNWDHQVRLFEEAAAFSPTERIHYVVPNAGIATQDEVFAFDGAETGPQKPNLKTIEVNLCGTLYTTKLALHYFIKQNGIHPSSEQEDTCLVLIGSGAAFLDCPRGPLYSATKWGGRGIMHALRRTIHYHGSRVNMLSPWYVRTSIIPESAFKAVEDQGVILATAEEAGECLLRILADTSINGRMLFLSGKKWSPRGYMDLDLDEYHHDPAKDIQADQVLGANPDEGLFLEGRW